eukprot:1620969-Pyramimonas_sp.AAC.1
MAERAAQCTPGGREPSRGEGAAAGLEFTPNPAATLERVRTQLRTPFLRLVKFSDDDLDMVRYPLQTPFRPPLDPLK